MTYVRTTQYRMLYCFEIRSCATPLGTPGRGTLDTVRMREKHPTERNAVSGVGRKGIFTAVWHGTVGLTSPQRLFFFCSPLWWDGNPIVKLLPPVTVRTGNKYPLSSYLGWEGDGKQGYVSFVWQYGRRT